VTKELILHSDNEYLALLKDIKQRLKEAQLKAAVAINRELLVLYWEIGHKIINQQQKANWGDKLLDTLARDLKSSFPEVKGFSKTNLKYMRMFAETYPQHIIGQTLSDQLPWSHHVALLQQTKSGDERLWYMQKAVKEGWSFRMLNEQIKSFLYKRQGGLVEKTSNFNERLPSLQSQLVLETLKDPYKFDFLMVGEDAHEREIERGLVAHITKFLLELGQGFAFVGSQYHLEIAGRDYAIDLLFYHLKLRSFVIVELKVKEFKPEHAGKLNFYLSAVDDLLRNPHDNPSIGLILCEKKDKLIAEYALKDIEKPIGISEYTLMRKLPKKLQTYLPTIEEIETELNIKLQQSLINNS
jgi:predicted nuclease of restriction endonuclease-like (RecB) superfamily